MRAMHDSAPDGATPLRSVPPPPGFSEPGKLRGPWRVIVNPASGRGKADAAERAIRRVAREEGLEIEVVRSRDGDDPLRWAESAEREGFRALVVAGGDGTAGAAARGLLAAGSGLPLGIVPLGTGNGLARVLRVPLDPGRAFRTLVAGRAVPLDVLDVTCLGDDGGAHETVALLFVGAGLDADLNRDADRSAKARFGFLAYVAAGLRNLVRLRAHRVRLTIDGESHGVAAHTVTIFNGGRLELAGVAVGPDADPHDGRADVAVLHATGFVEGLASVVRMATREGSRRYFAPASRVHVDARPPLTVHVDGEVVGTTPLTVRVRPAALQVLAAARYAPGEDRVDR